MLRAILDMRAVVADYTFGTVIVLVQLTLKGRGRSRVQPEHGY